VGANASSDLEISLATAIFGGKVEVKTIYGMKSLEIPGGIQSG
jgi:DnaJ-class molecular chaperone